MDEPLAREPLAGARLDQQVDGAADDLDVTEHVEQYVQPAGQHRSRYRQILRADLGGQGTTRHGQGTVDLQPVSAWGTRQE